MSFLRTTLALTLSLFVLTGCGGGGNPPPSGGTGVTVQNDEVSSDGSQNLLPLQRVVITPAEGPGQEYRVQIRPGQSQFFTLPPGSYTVEGIFEWMGQTERVTENIALSSGDQDAVILTRQGF